MKNTKQKQKVKKIKAYALTFDGSFTYYGGHLDRLAVFSKEEHARAFAEMFVGIKQRRKNIYKINPCTIIINPTK